MKINNIIFLKFIKMKYWGYHPNVFNTLKIFDSGDMIIYREYDKRSSYFYYNIENETVYEKMKIDATEYLYYVWNFSKKNGTDNWYNETFFPDNVFGSSHGKYFKFIDDFIIKKNLK
jgi:hypothetical protein